MGKERYLRADEERDNAGVVAPPPLIYAAPLVLGLLSNRLLPVRFLPQRARVFGWPLVVVGLMLGGWFFRTLRRAGTPVDPERPVSKLVVEEPYHHTRNPGYVSMAMIYTGVSVLANSLWSILLLPAALFTIQHGVIEREERYLERRFGEEYLHYKARVRRWV